MNKERIFKTNYFNQPWTWIIRIAESIIAILFIYWVDFQEIEKGSGLLWIGYSFAGALAVYILSRPIDDLALDREKLYHIQRSIIPFFNLRREYKISKIKEIRSASAFTLKSPEAGLFPSKISRSSIEITFKEDLTEKHSLTINKKELDKIVLKVKAMMK